MHAESALLATHDKGLELGDVVADVVDHIETELPRPETEGRGEALPYPEGHHLSIGESVVGRGRHGAQILTPLGRVEWGAAELAIRQLDAVTSSRAQHGLQMIRAHLMTQTARSRVNRDRDLVLEQPQRLCRLAVEDPRDILDLGKVVAGSQGAQLPLCLSPKPDLETSSGAAPWMQPPLPGTPDPAAPPSPASPPRPLPGTTRPADPGAPDANLVCPVPPRWGCCDTCG